MLPRARYRGPVPLWRNLRLLLQVRSSLRILQGVNSGGGRGKGEGKEGRRGLEGRPEGGRKLRKKMLQ